MSLFGGLYVGNSGLQTSQNALNTVAHNMVNVDTEGYTRQQISLTTRSYNTISKSGSAISMQQIGLGVSYDQVKQVRDYFLDKSFRRESGRAGFYNRSCDAIEEVEEIFQELDGESFSLALNNLWESVQELAKDPSNTVNQGIFVQRSSEFITRGQIVYENLVSYQSDLNYDVKQNVDRINSIGERIVELNDRILKIESGQVEKANDLKDERNRLVDELSSFVNMSLDTDIEGNFIIQIEGVDFVSAGDCKKIGLFEDPTTHFYTPYWEALAKKDAAGKVTEAAARDASIFNLNIEISTDMNTDIGSLKSTLLARGDRRTTFDDVSTGAKYDLIKDSVVMNVMAEFDSLIHDVTEGINKVFEKACFDYYGVNNLTDLRAKNPTYLFDPTTKEPYKIFDVYASDPLNPGMDYTTPNICINETLKQAPSLLGLIRPDGKVDQTCADSLKQFFAEETHHLNPEVKTATNLVSFYNNLISQVANTGFVMRGVSKNQELTVSNLKGAREEVIGVSTDEELSNMIMFQNAFNASSRYINTMSEMIEHLITTLGS